MLHFFFRKTFQGRRTIVCVIGGAAATAVVETENLLLKPLHRTRRRVTCYKTYNFSTAIANIYIRFFVRNFFGFFPHVGSNDDQRLFNWFEMICEQTDYN